MADATIAADAPAGNAVEGRSVYEAGAIRRGIYMAVFMILLPFFVSLGPMLYWRITQGHWDGTPGLIILAIGFTLVMGLIVFELLFSINSRVEFDEDSVYLRLPAGRGPTPMVRYKSYDIPYSDIAAVEVRREIYGGSLAPVILRGARVLKKDGSAVKLGYVSEAEVDPRLPYTEIAEKIAARAGVQIIDGGRVRRSWRRKMLGLKATEEQIAPVEESEFKQINRRHNRLMTVLIGGIGLLVALGIIADQIRI